MQFHESMMGAKFFNSMLPKLINSLESISVELKRSNDLKERQLLAEQEKKEERA